MYGYLYIFYHLWFYLTLFSVRAETCRFCLGTGFITIELDQNEKEVSKCVNCEGAGSITCTTCQGSGVQPRYLDRRQVLFYGYTFIFCIEPIMFWVFLLRWMKPRWIKDFLSSAIFIWPHYKSKEDYINPYLLPCSI